MTEADIKAELARGQAEAVRMLDTWAAKTNGSWKMTAEPYDPARPFWGCHLSRPLTAQEKADGRCPFDPAFYSTTSPEAARANAAEAIRGEL